MAYRQRIQDAILRLGYYWFQFMPLSRGSSMVGLVSILGLSLAADMQTKANVPKGVQVDWEALLASHFTTFNNSVAPWLFKEIEEAPWHLPSVHEALPTTRHVIAALSYDHKN